MVTFVVQQNGRKFTDWPEVFKTMKHVKLYRNWSLSLDLFSLKKKINHFFKQNASVPLRQALKKVYCSHSAMPNV